VLAKWFDVDAAWTARTVPWHTTSPQAARPYLEGLSFFRKGDKSAELADRAASALETCASLDPAFASANCMAGFAELQVYGKNGDKSRIDEALKHGRAARNVAPRFTDAGVVLANAFRAQENADSAEACYRRVLALEPGNVTAGERLGNLYTGENRLREAEDCYLRATTENRDYWVAFRILGLFYYNQHRLDDAATAWDRALELAPRDVVTLNNLGAVHYYRGEWPQAQDAFLQSFRVRPDCLSCNNVATTLFLRGDFKAAAKYFELALSPAYCDSADYVGWGNWGSALYWTDDGRSRALPVYRRAITGAETALKASPDSPDIIADLVDYYAMTGDSTRARAMITRAQPYLEKDEKVMYRVGSAYEKLGERDMALHQLANAVRHGYPLPAILDDPVLRNLVHDLRFDEMVRNQVAAVGAEAARNTR
jgi:serine/threonine-protein kinase